ncbi:MAG TPA: NAD(P)H-dependent oxidoreductase [Candidatus Sulfotelmatobacter sp.]|nr:NAD(P)H-dependent oxidoreductase [Candidatus Sulfotelmatobacter sp.]
MPSLFATPEYDCGIAGVLKNAIDWTKPLGNSRSSCCKISWIGPIASGSELRAGKVFIHLLQPRSLVTQNEPSAFDAD